MISWRHQSPTIGLGQALVPLAGLGGVRSTLVVAVRRMSCLLRLHGNNYLFILNIFSAVRLLS